MIKLTRPAKPTELAKNEIALTKNFIETDKNVWSKPYILKALEDMTKCKCSYCETSLNEQGINKTVDHFHYKDKYPDEVVKWDNLFLCCSQCNSNKGECDTYVEPFINPAEENPQDFIGVKFYRLKSKDNDKNSKGRYTIDHLDLNNRIKLVNPRIKIADSITEKLDSFLNRALKLEDGSDTRSINKTKLKNGIRDILLLVQPDAEYSAFMATILINDDDYVRICDIMKSHGLWNIELDLMHKIAEKIKFDIL